MFLRRSLMMLQCVCVCPGQIATHPGNGQGTGRSIITLEYLKSSLF